MKITLPIKTVSESNRASDDWGCLLRQRHSELIDKKFLSGLTDDEAGELDGINKQLDEIETRCFESIDVMDIFKKYCERGGTFVFWTCPNSCGDVVKWNEDKTIATCAKCGTTNTNQTNK